MKIAIIGAGNIGGALVACLADGHLFNQNDIIVTNPHPAKLDALKSRFPQIVTTDDNRRAVDEADVVVLAVNPWKIGDVLRPLRFSHSQILVSLAAGVSITHIARLAGTEMPFFRAVPSMALAEHSSLTILASRGASEAQTELVKDIFEEGGNVMFVRENQLDVSSALTSSGVAFAMKYVYAAMQAGIELGLEPKDAMKMISHSMEGAAEILLNHDTHPVIEIEKVATPGGITIKGLNQLEMGGFTKTVIKAVKASAVSLVDSDPDE